jgi:Alpha/beta hydrolase domain
MRTITRFCLLAVVCAWPLQFVGAQARERTLHIPLPPHRDAIGTHVAPQNRSDPAIDTHVDTVTLSDPVRVQRAGLEYFEVRGTVEGVGWGGNNGINLESHYTYKFPYVLRVPVNWNGTLVVFRHGSAGMLVWKRAEVTLGSRNVGRTFHEYADRLISDVALHPARGWAYFSVNYTPFAVDGKLTTYLLPGTDDDNDGRVDEDPAQDDDRDGLEDEDERDGVDNDLDGLVDEDPSVDDDRDGRVNEDPGRTPVHAQTDPTIARDTTLAAWHLLKVITARSPSVTLGVGHSAGASMNTQMNTGMVPGGRASGRRYRFGDNFVEAYNPDSGTIFDGFVAFGGGGMGSGLGAIPIDPTLGISAPTLFLQGEGDMASMGAVHQVREMMDRGLSASSLARIYMVRNVPHIDSDFVRGEACGIDCTPPAQQPFFRAGGDRWKPMAAALLDALRRWVVDGNPPPQSILSGAPLDLNGDGAVDSLRFPQSGSPSPGFSLAFPYVDDPSLDQASGPPPTSLQNNVTLSSLWVSVQQALSAQVDSVFLPETACRRGRSSIVRSGPTGVAFVPFDQPTFLARWGSFAAYQTCRVQTVDALVAKGLYDPTVVTIDVRPDQFPNRIDSRDSGLVPVAIFTTRGFDATHINVASLKLGEASRSRGDEAEVQDVNGDGRPDIVVSFPARDVRPTRPGDIIVELEGRTWSGLPFSGTDLADFVN